jgi:hypothetical protein
MCGCGTLYGPNGSANRVITHVCAPVFFLLAGAGACLSMARGKSLPQVSRFFWTRGLWLIFLELTVLRFAWNFSFASVPFVQVIWALGWSMVAMALIVRLPVRWIAGLGATEGSCDRATRAQLTASIQKARPLLLWARYDRWRSSDLHYSPFDPFNERVPKASGKTARPHPTKAVSATAWLEDAEHNNFFGPSGDRVENFGLCQASPCRIACPDGDSCD